MGEADMIWWPILLIAAVIIIAVLLTLIAKRDRAGRTDDPENEYLSIDDKEDVIRKNSVFSASKDTYLNHEPYGGMVPRDIGDEKSDAERL
jgi:hypothetical protein